IEKAPSKTGGGSRTSRAGGGPTRSAETAGQLQSAGSRAAEGGDGAGARASGARASPDDPGGATAVDRAAIAEVAIVGCPDGAGATKAPAAAKTPAQNAIAITPARARVRRWGRRWVITRSTWACGSGIGELQAHRYARGAAAGGRGNGGRGEARCWEGGHGAGVGGVGAQPPVAGIAGIALDGGCAVLAGVGHGPLEQRPGDPLPAPAPRNEEADDRPGRQGVHRGQETRAKGPF